MKSLTSQSARSREHRTHLGAAQAVSATHSRLVYRKRRASTSRASCGAPCAQRECWQEGFPACGIHFTVRRCLDEAVKSRRVVVLNTVYCSLNWTTDSSRRIYSVSGAGLVSDSSYSTHGEANGRAESDGKSKKIRPRRVRGFFTFFRPALVCRPVTFFNRLLTPDSPDDRQRTAGLHVQVQSNSTCTHTP